ncbi:type II toxin-antitoxin system prevent-host-death family antitoxin [Photorhabdus sp. SF281]|uniref:type II toxin-antitoxin system prevent-host-death family antitoxin n=1 Tax=Photorhabdus sp. SF281 TaxID=3459527 RepID=UPI0040447D39
MRNTTYGAARANLASIMDQAVQDCAPILITRQNGGDCVIISSAEYASLEETAYLLRSSANAKH